MHLIFTKVTLPYRRAVNQYFSDFFYVKTLVEFFCFKLITQIFFRFVLSCCHSFIFHIYFLQSQNFLQMRILQSRLKGQKKNTIQFYTVLRARPFFLSVVVCSMQRQSSKQRPKVVVFVCLLGRSTPPEGDSKKTEVLQNKKTREDVVSQIWCFVVVF